jgi:hypothetical protein
VSEDKGKVFLGKKKKDAVETETKFTTNREDM